jgi:hypothetical protein
MASTHALQVLFLDRLGYLVELSENVDAAWTPAERRLLEHALYSTYRDCDAVGLTVVARAMLAVTSTIPIMSTGGGDLVRSGLAASFARPGATSRG